MSWKKTGFPPVALVAQRKFLQLALRHQRHRREFSLS